MEVSYTCKHVRQFEGRSFPRPEVEKISAASFGTHSALRRARLCLCTSMYFYNLLIWLNWQTLCASSRINFTKRIVKKMYHIRVYWM